MFLRPCSPAKNMYKREFWIEADFKYGVDFKGNFYTLREFQTSVALRLASLFNQFLNLRIHFFPGRYQIVGTQLARDNWQDCPGIGNELKTQEKCREAAQYLGLRLGSGIKQFYYRHPCQNFCFLHQNEVYFSTNTAPDPSRLFTSAKVCGCH